MRIIGEMEKWKDSGEYNLYFLSTLIRTQVYSALHRNTDIAEKFYLVPYFQKCSLILIEYIINIGTQCSKTIHLYSKPHFHIFTRKKGHYQCFQNLLLFHIFFYV